MANDIAYARSLRFNVYGVPPPIRGHFLDDVLNNDLRPVDLWRKSNQQFGRYATAFEKTFSILTGGGASPVIDSDLPAFLDDSGWPDYEVMGHLGWFGGDTVHVPRGRSGTGLNNVHKEKAPIWVALYPPMGYVSYASSEEKYRLVTDINGRIIWILGRDVGGLNAPGFLAGQGAKQVEVRAIKALIRLVTKFPLP